MDSSVRQRLVDAQMRGLNPSTTSHSCKVCGGSSELFDVVDFNKFCSQNNFYRFGLAGVAVSYLRCSNCGFLFTTFCDEWSPGDFATFIYNDEYIKVDPEYVEKRPLESAERLAEALKDWHGARILDFGGGAGVFARTLRERGFNAETYDPFSSPQRPAGRFDLVTCYEVLEHTPDPLATIRDLASFLNDDGIVIFSTGIQPYDIEQIRANWWYVAPRNGHISIYTHKALGRAGESAGLIFHAGQRRGWSRAGSAESSRRLRELAGEPLLEIPLGAPTTNGPTQGIVKAPDGCWHSLETAHTRFRWTASNELEWVVRPPLAGVWQLRFEIPWLMEIEPGFAAASRLLVDGQELPIAHEGKIMRASTTLNVSEQLVVRLETPPTRSPHEVYGRQDGRSLGLAIAATH